MIEEKRSRLRLTGEFVLAAGVFVGIVALIVNGIQSGREEARKRGIVCAQVNADLVEEISGRLQELSEELGPGIQVNVEVELLSQGDLEDNAERGYYPSARGDCSEDGLHISSHF